jgi:hypothetical protein
MKTSLKWLAKNYLLQSWAYAYKRWKECHFSIQRYCSMLLAGRRALCLRPSTWSQFKVVQIFLHFIVEYLFVLLRVHGTQHGSSPPRLASAASTSRFQSDTCTVICYWLLVCPNSKFVEVVRLQTRRNRELSIGQVRHVHGHSSETCSVKFPFLTLRKKK